MVVVAAVSLCASDNGVDCIIQADIPGIHGQCALLQASSIPYGRLPRDSHWLFRLCQVAGVRSTDVCLV